MAKTYCILAGPVARPETVERGVLEKGMGQTSISGETVKAMHSRADIGVPNYTEAWGVRLINGEIPDYRVTVTDPKYKGEVKWLKWGDPKGVLITARYLRGYDTLDIQYQDTVLGAKNTIREDTEASADAFFLRMQSGDNWYDPESDKCLVEMYRIHYMNRSSISKGPECQTSMFEERTTEAVQQKETKTFTSKFDALKIVNEAANDSSLQKLRNLQKILSGILDQEAKDEDIYRYLSMKADENPDLFLGQIAQYKRNVSDVFEKLKSYSAIDLATDGKIGAGQSKKELVAEGIPAKKDAMLEWLLANPMDGKSYDATFKLIQIANSLK